MNLVVQITSSWCIDAYVKSVRPLVLTDRISKAKGFTHADAALAWAKKIPSPITDSAPPTTFRLVRRTHED